MAIPTLTPEERQAALEKAKEARQKRAQIREDLKTGKLALEEVLDMKDDEVVGRTKVTALLEAIHGIGPARAEKIMEQADIAPSRRIKGIGSRQREKLLELLKEH